MVVDLHPEALAEYAEAVGFYEQHAPGLGRQFFEEVQRVLRLIERIRALVGLSTVRIVGRTAVDFRSASRIERVVTS